NCQFAMVTINCYYDKFNDRYKIFYHNAVFNLSYINSNQGSPDACYTIHNSNREMDAKMRIAAAELNLKPHVVRSRTPPHRFTELCTAADVEGHYVDGSFYLLDLSRVFPCEAPDPR